MPTPLEMQKLKKTKNLSGGTNKLLGNDIKKEGSTKELVSDLGGGDIKPLDKSTDTKDLIGVKGYDKDQVGIPGVNLIEPPKILPEEEVRDEFGKLETDVDQTDVLKGQLTDVEFNKQQAEQDKLAAQETERTKQIAESEQSYRTDKDWLTTLQERETADLKDQYDDAITKAEIAHKQLLNNVNMARGGLGMPHSTAEEEGFDTIKKENVRQLNRLREMSSTQSFRLTENYEKAFDDLNTERKKVFDDNMRKLLDELSMSDLEGGLDTREGLDGLKTKLQDILYSDEEMAVANIQRYQFGINQLSSQIDDLEEWETKSGTIDETQSKMNGFYTNENGDPFLDSNGEQISMPDDSEVMYSSDPDAQGNMTFVMKDAQGNLSMKKFNTGITGQVESPKIQTVIDSAGNKVSGYFDKNNKFIPITPEGTGLPQKQEWTKLNEKQLYEKSSGIIKDAVSGEVTGQDYNLVDWSDNQELINKYPGEASFKNNNPTGMTWGISNNLKGLFDKAGIKYSQGSERPTAEGGNYIKFASAQDGLDAYRIALTEAGSQDIKNRLATWVGTMDTANNNRYANDIMEQAGIEQGARFDDLSEDQLGALMSAQLQRESPNFYKELSNIDSQQEDRGVTGVLGVPIAYERQIKQMVPTTLMNSEIELEQLNDTIKAMDKAGMPVEDAVLTYLGFNVTPESKEDAMEYISVGRNMGEDLPSNFYATVSNYINKGDINKADRYVSNIVEDKAKKRYGDDLITTASMNQTNKDTNKLSSLISKNPDKIGAFDGNVTELMRKFKDYPEMQELATLLTMTQAETRKHFAGSAVTPSEMVALQDFIGGNVKMTPNNLLVMLETIKDRTESQFTLQRKQFGYTPKPRDDKGNIIKTAPINISGPQTLGSLGVGLGAALGTGRGVKQDLDEVDNEFFTQPTGDLDQVDEDFFNNL